MAAHVSRLTLQLRALLQSQRVAALGSIAADGAPLVSMVPFAVEHEFARLVIHVSELAAHTRNLLERPRVSLMVMQAELAGEAVHALPRVTFDAIAAALPPQGEEWEACSAAYLRRFPEAEPMTQLADFRFVALHVTGARQVAGFGSARSIDEAEVRLALQPG
jgi:heme iron utilization protein